MARLDNRLSFTLAMIMNVLQMSNSSWPCSIRPDPKYNGNVINCSQTELSSKDIANLEFINTTTLIISKNPIKVLPNNSFHQFTQLKSLECTSCDLSVLGVDSLRGLGKLEALDLSDNFLKIINHAFPSGFFNHVPRLKTLYIGDNGNFGNVSTYSEYIDLFDSLPQLTEMTIDSFSNLTIGEEFTKLKQLNTLKITCNNLVTVSNDSLKGFVSSNVAHFSLINGGNNFYDLHECESLFQYLPNISSLTIKNMRFGNFKVMMMMEPLQGKQIDLLHFDNVGIHYTVRSKDKRIHDVMITADMLKYLKVICVSHFVWIRNYALMLDSDAMTSHAWPYCLKSIIFVTGGTDILVDPVYLAHIIRLRKVERLIYMVDLTEQATDFWKQNSKTDAYSFTKDNSVQTHVVFEKIRQFQDSERLSQTTSQNNNCSHHSVATKINDEFNNKTTKSSFGVETTESKRSSLHLNNDPIPVNIPPFLTTIVLDDLLAFSIVVNISVMKNTIRSITNRNAVTGSFLQGIITGMDHLESLDLTGSNIRGQPTFFRQFPNLSKISLRNTKQTSDYFSKVAENIPGLKYFDIAENGLQWLPQKMFHSNKKLKYLCLASNHFTMIPFDLKLTPTLECLDLRGNSLKLTRTDMQAIDDHLMQIRPTNFTLLLNKNQISCACSALPFIQWLQHSPIIFDEGGNYTCMTQSGTLSYTGLFSDVASFWRECEGSRYFLVSLILLSTLTALYMAAFLGMKHKTQILSQAMQLVVPGFRLKTRNDFTYDIVIGYANQDGDFVRDVLLRYLEDKWRLRTFVHQRDLLQDPLLMSQAIRDSWRNLLLITENFLNRYEMAHNVMKVCAFFVHPTNTRSVIVMVEERVRHQIPEYVLQVVDEDNIIVIPALHGPLDYETRETLRTRIF